MKTVSNRRRSRVTGRGSRVKCLDSLFSEGVNLVLCGQCFRTYRFACISMDFQASASKVTRKDKCVAFSCAVYYVAQCGSN